MGVRRYSRSPSLARWQQQFDHLQALCRGGCPSPTIGELTAHGIRKALWRCSAGFECMHGSEEFELARFSPDARVHLLKRYFKCSRCGTGRPNLELLWYGEGPQ